MKKTFIYTAAIASMVLALASCEKEPSNINEPKDGMRLHVVSNDIQTKAQQTSTNRIVSETIDLSEGDVNLFFTAVEEDNLGNEFLMEPQTKGTVITTANFAGERSDDFRLWLTTDGNSTYVEAGNSAHTLGAKDVPAILKDDYWYAMYSAGSEEYSNYIHWPEDSENAINFWCWSGATNATNLAIAEDGSKMSFDYTDASTTASAQKDLLFAYAGGKTEPSTKGNIDIHFYHALSAVQFCVGNIDESITITNIKVKNVYNKGVGSFIPSGACSNPGTDVSKDKTTGAKDTFNSDVTSLFDWAADESSMADYETGTISSNNTNETEFGTPFGTESASTFFFMPQNIADIEIEISIARDNNGTTATMKKKVTLGSVKYDSGVIPEWKAGKIYRYTISGAGEVAVGVAEDLTIVDATDNTISEKKNVKGENTGNISAYIRAAVVGNWYNDAHQIVAPFNSSSVLPTTLKDGWFSVAENYSEANCNVLFYYYNTAIEPGAKTSTNLIESYTKANAGAAPIEGAHLELNIIMQAIDSREGKETVAEMWGIDASKLN